ncbi:YicC family protein [Jeotgalibacillus sp. ET6]|uniref:YicC/YloC family endoribonuclease n=1 Tax=Jeotgalibacillus sp. ET6 TaxID=3037260 RepID=UPI00241847C7|nr:YicC/YloC family endoribonuclease [Jeotgalibacillus sp. ET6]MDG5470232.1 YicC family protein [Jeotgalibacillus sp. ET6]
MVVSMTGFGTGTAKVNDLSVTVEIKSVNHRYLECAIRVPREHVYLEEYAKRLIGQTINRGKVDVFISLAGSGAADRSLSIDWDLADAYFKYANQLKDRYNLRQEVPISYFLENPDLVSIKEAHINRDEVEPVVETALKQALDSLQSMRTAEGKELEKDILHHLHSFKLCTDKAAGLNPAIVSKYHTRLEKRIKEFADGQIDENRLLTEVAVFAEKTDVTEEFVRLTSHLNQFQNALSFDGAVGRKLDFLTQEMNREVNTIGSKANDAALVSLVVEMKSSLEKIREQIQNIE